MPVWYFFAFDAIAVEQAMLQRAQEAIRNRDVARWKKVHDLLQRTHASVITRGYFSPGLSILQCVGKEKVLSSESVPEESDFAVRRTLQTFVEQASQHRLTGSFTRARHTVLHEVDWTKIVQSADEAEELEIFKKNVIVRSTKLPDPFWCLESNSAVNSTYIEPSLVQEIAKVEATTGLLRSLARDRRLGTELHELARDLFAVGLLMELAASRNLAIYFREDDT
jgi:hypothetical protein